MPVATKPVQVTSESYTQLTAAQTGYALIYNPEPTDKIPRRLALIIATNKPDDDAEGAIVVDPNRAFQRTSDIDDYVWGKFVNGQTANVSVTE